jgi:hypothetical protein
MLKIYLTIISLSLCACAQEFPANYLYHIDANKQICDQYVIDKKNVKFKFSKAIPFAECPSTFGFTEEDTPKVLNWVRRMKKKVEACK